MTRRHPGRHHAVTRSLAAIGLRHLALTLAAAASIAVSAAWATAVWADAHLVAPAPTAFVLDRQGAFLFQAGHESRRPGGGRQVEYGYWPIDLPPAVIAATLALEDRRFWSHPGIDPLAILRAAAGHLATGQGGGASTIAMQVARMQHRRPRTLWAKAVEAGTAVALTLRYGRAAVLAQYVRLAPYAEGSHGVAHAARWYFDRPAADLSAAQAAMLCALPQAPGLMSLRPRSIERTRARARRALLAMDLPGDDRTAALAELATLAPRLAPRRPADLLAIARLQATMPQATSGRTLVRASLDLGIQAAARHSAAAHIARWRHEGAQQAAVLVVRRSDRAVLADVGALSGGIDFTRTPRSPGSTLKPFLYALGLDRGLVVPEDIVADRPEGSGGIHNADHDYLGPLLPRQALANSRNVPATNLLRAIGLNRAFAFLHTLGLHDLDGPAEHFGLAMAIGALPTTPERLTRAYLALADDGMDRGLTWFMDAAPAPASRWISTDAARLVGRFLSDPVARLPAFPRYGSSEFPFAVALKTGTSQGYRDAWTVAWSRDYLVAVWMGRADAGPMTRLSGARSAAGLAQEVMLRLHGALRTDLVAGDLPAPAGRVLTELCMQTGQAAGPGCGASLAEWVRPGVAPTQAAPVQRLAITRPEADTHVWRNPDLPATLNRIVLRATAEPRPAQLAWLVDGQVVAVRGADEPLIWTMVPGRHSFQVRLPLQPDASRPVTVIVE